MPTNLFATNVVTNKFNITKTNKMYIEQIYTNCLAQASYYIESDGEAAIIDPMRDIEKYVTLASARKAKIKYIFLTHFHADFVSGHLDLAEKTSATIVFGPNAKPNYPAFVAEDKYHFYLGTTKIKILHTPGHTVESSCFLAFDAENKPYALFSGDTLFIGDVGRPDLLSGNLSKEELASMLYDSLNEKIRPLSDNVIIYPGHGAGSACGKNLSKETWSTLGEQKKTNYALSDISRQEFIKLVTTEQPTAPAYFFKDAAINIKGYGSLDNLIEKSLVPLTIAQVKEKIADGFQILDTRQFVGFGEFIKGSVIIGLDGQFAVWCGTLLDFSKKIILVTDPGKEREVIVRLARVGIENVEGYLNATINDWIICDGPVDIINTIDVCPVKEKIFDGSFIILDVRNRAEAAKEKIHGSIDIPLDELPSAMDSLSKSNKYLVYCAGGYRSVIAVSLLKKSGFENLVNVSGGINKIKNTCKELVES
jgi:hydroxyacylglutathione hydrolase